MDIEKKINDFFKEDHIKKMEIHLKNISKPIILKKGSIRDYYIFSDNDSINIVIEYIPYEVLEGIHVPKVVHEFYKDSVAYICTEMTIYEAKKIEE